jgi:hypothetical protein
MKLGFFAVAGLLICGSAVAQDNKDTRITVQDGKEMTVTGCLARTAEGGYSLTNVTGKDGVVGSYVLAASKKEDDLDDLDKHIGHRLEIDGKAADKGSGKLTVETKNDGKKGKTETKSEVKGDLSGLPYLGVKSFRMLATVCP